MRNKLKRSKAVKDTGSQSKAQTSEVIILSDSSCSDGETSRTVGGKHFSNTAAGFSERQFKQLQEENNALSAKDTKIAPIFLRTRQQSKSKRSSDGEKTQKSVLPPQSDDLQVSHLTGKDDSVLPSCRRGQLLPSALHSCLEEIQTSNPAFPVQAVFRTLQKKASEGLQECESTGCSSHPGSLLSFEKEKRRRENEISERTPKRLRSNFAAEDAAGISRYHLSVQEVQGSRVPAVQKQPRSSRLSRTHKLKQQTGRTEANLVTSCEPISGWRNRTESDTQSLKNCETLQGDSCFENVLWTDKYSPQDSSEVIGNSASVKRLNSWLKKWKLRADRDESRKVEERRREENSNDSWDCGDFQGEAGSEEPLCNTMLITGPSGVGKTASVYACAQELGFKVFEVNCSSQRSGRHVLSQLQEATQSHLVEMSGTDSLKPAYFNNYCTNSSTNKPETLPGKSALHRNLTSTRKKKAARILASSCRKVKAKPATVTLVHYFKMKTKADRLHFDGLSPCEKTDSKKLDDSSPGCDQTAPQNKKTATSLILFEEVDVIFDDDVGFLAAIKAFMTTTKRPVILTTNDPTFKERFDCSLEEIIFKTPSAVNVCSYLQLVCLVEKVRLDLDDVRGLLRLSRGDVRRCLLQLQFWVYSGGRRTCQSGSFPKGPLCIQYSNATEEGNRLDSQLPPCKTGCSANMLGLHPVTPNYLVNLLKGPSWSEVDMNKLLNVLTESWRRAVPLLYSNLELLLSIGAKGTLVHNMDKGILSGLQNESPPSNSDLYFQKQNQNVRPNVSVSSSKPVRNVSRLSRRKCISSSSDPSSHKPHITSLNETPPSSPSSSDKTEQKVTSGCLEALTDFFDLMSYLDATLPAAEMLLSGSCTPEAFVWTGAELKDGLLDEMSEEEGWSWSQERLLDIRAAVEGLGCHRYWWRVSEVWTGAQKYRQKLEDKKWGRLVESQALTASSQRQSLSFGFPSLCASSVSQRRYRLSRTVLSSKSFSLLGNRQAVSVDYMPALRSICRSHRAQQQQGETVRCLNDLSSTHLGLSNSTMQLLAEDFTSLTHFTPTSIYSN
ncbi:ATPase family AAA domain-containing protein 5b isoform X2 [Acanthochromis polyacanthus]|uniref:ATPase family AAA domain-containing protein 5b isoform X2 n=1 Tax=Acanthochromis polyacanthus TaxID=80966 RepID=UPI002233E89D|nr:ATPase family AAA domain-containing protein 5b isoform X2 [Acanthochromis polyacanthus]